MKLALGPVLFYWSRERLLDFYAQMAAQPLDVIYLGETVCAKRRALSLDDWIGLGRELAQSSGVQVVLSGLALIEAASELASLRRLCDNGEFLVEANDMGAVQFMHERGRPFVAGPAINLYNAQAVNELMDCGMQRWVPPVEFSARLLEETLAALDEQQCPRPELEVFAYGHLPLAYSARCFTARAVNRPKDDCRFCCIDYPEGIELTSQEGQQLFTLNGIQTLSGDICNLLPEYPRLQALGVDILRLSPRAEGMAEVIEGFDKVRRGDMPPLGISAANGYWFGRAGMSQIEGEAR